MSRGKLLRAASIAAACLLLAPAATGQTQAPPPAPIAQPSPSIAWGAPWCGRLFRGRLLPHEGAHHFTWDGPLRRSPNRYWRRYGTDRLLRTLTGVVYSYALAHPGLARIGIGDLSLPSGGAFGDDYGGLGHNSHQNGLDADVLYPRRDRAETRPLRIFDVDRARAQDLVDRFVAAGAQYVFVGQSLGLRGPPRIVRAIPFHDDHLHVRIPPAGPVRAPVPCPWRPA